MSPPTSPRSTQQIVLKTAFISHLPHVIILPRNAGIEFLSSAFESDETPVQPLKKQMDLVWGHSSLGLCKYNTKWQYIPTTWGTVELMNQIRTRPLFCYGGCYGDD